MSVPKLISAVPGFEGECRPTWLNRNQIDIRLTGGVSGFFKLVKRYSWFPFPVKVGREFHGIIRESVVYSEHALRRGN